jgi:hypothetical protein
MGEQNALFILNTSEGRYNVLHSLPLCDFYKACCMTFQCFNIFDEITYIGGNCGMKFWTKTLNLVNLVVNM